jgi:high-affinity K+ transport system ATPase subunit B
MLCCVVLRVIHIIWFLHNTVIPVGNNFHQIKKVGGKLDIVLKYDGQGGDVVSICRNIRLKQLVVLKDATQNGMSARIEKMRSRGWKIT